MGISPDFAADIRRAQQLEEQRQRDPRAVVPLIQVYKRMLERLRPNEDPTLYATLQNNLGNAYRELPTGDRAANLAQAIGCYQQALRFWTAEAGPLKYALTQNNLALSLTHFWSGLWRGVSRGHRHAHQRRNQPEKGHEKGRGRLRPAEAASDRSLPGTFGREKIGRGNENANEIFTLKK